MRPTVVEYHTRNTGRMPVMLRSMACVLALLALYSGCIPVTASGDEQATFLEISGTMTDPSHSSKADPDYSVVFPDDRVNTLTISISPENWQVMLANMTELYGEFGGSSSGGGGRQGGQGMGGMFSEADPVYVPADVTFEGQEWTSVGIRFKGFNSLQGSWREGSYKISLKLNFDKFEDEFPEIKNQRFYGFDELNLQGNYNDDSLLREMVVPSIFRESGVAAPCTAFYRLFVDYGEGPVYFGLYTMVEAVEDTVITTQFADDSGNLYKPEGTGATFAEGTFDTASFEKKTNEKAADWSDVEALYRILNSDTRLSDPARWRAELEAVFDVDIFLRWLATNTVIQNWDTYGGNCRNFYLYTDPATGKITWIPWDNNYALSGGMSSGNQGPEAGGRGDVPGMNDAAIGPAGEDPGLSSAEVLAVSRFAGTDTLDPAWSALAEDRVRVTERFAQNGTPQAAWTRPDDGQVPADRAPGDQAPEGMNAGGGMGRTLSLGLDEVGENWPLIRYLADDPVYSEQYQYYVGLVATTSFEPAKMEEIYRYYHSLIEPYVTGPEGEQSGYTHLDSPEGFDTALDDLIAHAYSRYDAVVEYLSGTPIPTPTPTATPVPTLTPTSTSTPTVLPTPTRDVAPGLARDIVLPRVTLTSPTLYSGVAPGEELAITWSATDAGGIAGVIISYSVNRGISWTTVATDLPAAGTVKWTVPEDDSAVLTLKVTAVDTAGNTGSARRIIRLVQAGSPAFFTEYTVLSAVTDEEGSRESLRAAFTSRSRFSLPDAPEIPGAWDASSGLTYGGSSPGSLRAAVLSGSRFSLQDQVNVIRATSGLAGEGSSQEISEDR